MNVADPPLSGLPVLRVRDESVSLDSELAALYGVETKVFNQAIKRNAHRFPGDFAFQLSEEVWAALRSQIVTLAEQPRYPMNNIILFEEKYVRRAWNETEGKWYFAIVDVIAVLTGSPNPQVYWRVLKKRLRAEGIQTVTNCNALREAKALRASKPKNG